ncbi:TetR family transcriptional regulator [Caenispirillum bisanense]|uniref:Transcriptional regulator, TetR family n=1 Tax=Caenispirillum bisanense TaxID=414052 RepID=A0A286GG65_9PROT|nr:TetR family transcriptional regulator [Caenispirillum bisanense]SOD94525.1 transcriptional regulator, TetR family [Caenispirillum bisanense]
MVRTAKFTDDAFLTAAVGLIARGGPQAATIAAIARAAGAPSGSIYHRFASRDALVARAWLDVHAGLRAALLPRLAAGDGAAAAQALVRWAAAHPVEAAFLLPHETEDLIGAAPPEDLRAAVEAAQGELDDAFLAFCRRIGAAGEEDVAFWRYAVFDGPIALLRPYLRGGEPLPPWLPGLLPRALPAGAEVVAC